MGQYLLKKEAFHEFIIRVRKSYDLVAPVNGKETRQNSKSYFAKVESSDEIFLDKKTYHTVKSFFFHPEEVLFEFSGNKIVDPTLELTPTVYFGLRRCDLNGIYHQDILFLEEHTDPFYKARRDASLLIGYHCKEGDEYCFCESFDLKDFFDLMFYDKGDRYLIESGSKKGEAFAKKFLKKTEEKVSEADRKTINHKHMSTLDIKDYYNSDDWKEGADRCLACGACNFLCMNCHCFSIDDDVNMDLKTGKRVRKPASCQLRHFTRVAGDYIFRDSKLARFKHRIYHQIQYFKDRHDVVFCTGCGRCIEGCPAQIDWVKIINCMKK